jgi:hypothetical protein
MSKHFGGRLFVTVGKTTFHSRWVIALVIALTVASWLLERAVGQATFMRALWVIFFTSSVSNLLVAEHRRGARPGLPTIVATLVAAAISGWILFELDARWWIKGLLLIVLALPLMSIANAAYRADVLWAQQQRDAHATRLAQAVLAGDPVERFALYLRPFVSTDRLMAQALPSSIDVSEVPVHLDVETLLVRSFRATVPVVALGRSGEMVEGAGRVTTSDDHWRETEEALALHADFIAMVPLPRPSTMWELERLKQRDLLSKVLFIMPETPQETPGGVGSSQETDDRIFDAGVRRFEAEAHMLDLAKEWLKVECVAGGFGLEFPPLAAVGALYTMNPTTGAVKDIVPLALSTLTRRISYLRTSVMRLGLLPASKAPVDFLKDFVKAVGWGGRTREYALMRAVDGFAVWGDAVMATSLIQRAVETGQLRPEIATEYIHALPTLMEERVKMGDVRAAVHYAEFARRACADSMLASLTTNETLNRIDSLFENLRDLRPEL